MTDKLLTLKEIAERLGTVESDVIEGWRTGRYSFILKDEGKLIGSEEGLTRWLKARSN
jgi:hypothetical protein